MESSEEGGDSSILQRLTDQSAGEGAKEGRQCLSFGLSFESQV